MMRIKFELIIVYIQSFFRMCLAKNQRLRLLQEKNSVLVQKFLRKYMAKKVYFKMITDAYH